VTPSAPKPRIVAIVQARMTSSRLPGKVLRPLAGQSVLWHVLTRAQAIPGVDLVCCATTEGPEADPLVEEAARVPGVAIFRGSSDDVLDRYLRAAKACDAGIVMRITSDCPLIDPVICGELLALRERENADYASNVNPRGFPHGLDCEVFTYAALERAAEEATEPVEREHVTPWLRGAAGLKRSFLIGPGWPAVEHRWTLDYPEDLAFFEALFRELPPPPAQPGMQSVLSILARRPDIPAINGRRRMTLAPIDDRRPVAVFRFDAGPEIGGGHAMRSATLMSAMQDAGWHCLRMVNEATRRHLGLELSDPHLVLVEGDEIAAAQKLAQGGFRAALLVVDHYGLGKAFEQAARGFAGQVVVIDDLADRDHDADLLIDTTPAQSPGRYVARLPATAQQLLGPQFALLRPQFLAARATACGKAAGGRILVNFGAIDRENATSLALDALVACGAAADADIVMGGRAPYLTAVASRAAQVGARLHVDVADMARIMADAELCIGAGGTGVFERCALGLPSLLVGIAGNQRDNIAALCDLGVAENGGWIGSLTASAMAGQIDGLLRNKVRLEAMRRAAMTLVDGRGVQRIMLALCDGSRIRDGARLRLRLAEPSDEDLLLEWQRAPETRRYARNPAPPEAEEHRHWFAARLASPHNFICMGEVAGAATGMLRLQRVGDALGRPIFEISILTAPDRHGGGIARAMLAEARKLLPGAEFLAQILEGNEASRKLFAAAGFRRGKDNWYRQGPSWA